MKKRVRILQIFADGKRFCVTVPTEQYVMRATSNYDNSCHYRAESIRTRVAQWIQQAQDKLTQELLSLSAIEVQLSVLLLNCLTLYQGTSLAHSR